MNEKWLNLKTPQKKETPLSVVMANYAVQFQISWKQRRLTLNFLTPYLVTLMCSSHGSS